MAELSHYKIPERFAGQRLDVALAELSQVSRSQTKRWFDDALVRIDGAPARAAVVLRGGENIEVTLPGTAPTSGAIPDIEVVYEDENLLIIEKPAGLLVHDTEARSDQPTVAAWAATRVEDSDSERPGIIHRLDRDTSGLLVLAKHPAAKAALQQLWQDRHVRKTYQTLVVGQPQPAEATIKLPIARSRRTPTKRAVVPGGREATTHYRTLAVYPGASLLEVDLETGRTHQIRVHMAHIGHPVVGDALYGGMPSKTSPLPALARQFLHASRLEFVGPSGQNIDVSSSLPPDLVSYIELIEPDRV